MNIKKGVIMDRPMAKVHEIVSKVTITNTTTPEIAQTILSWTKDTVPQIHYKDKF